MYMTIDFKYHNCFHTIAILHNFANEYTASKGPVISFHEEGTGASF